VSLPGLGCGWAAATPPGPAGAAAWPGRAAASAARLAHTAACPWHSSGLPPRWLPPKPQLLCGARSQPPPNPLSALNDPLVHTRHTAVVTVREQVSRWVQLVSILMVNSAWAGDVRWVCSWAGWTGTPPHPPPPGSQAACASCRSPKALVVSSDTRHSTPLHGVTARRRDTLECTCWSEGGSALWVVCELLQFVSSHAFHPESPVKHSAQVGVTAVHGTPLHTHILTHTSRIFSVSAHLRRDATRLCTSPLGASRSAAGHFAAVNGPACRI
jgi:hypothetical protein